MSEAPYPPAETPADGDRTSHVSQPRYSASASVPAAPPVPPQGQTSYPGSAPDSPHTGHEGSGYGVASPGFGQYGQQPGGAGPTSGGSQSGQQAAPGPLSARIAASASVSVPPPFTPPAQPAPPGAASSAMAMPGGFGAPAGPASAASAPMGPPPMGSPPGGHPGGAPHMGPPPMGPPMGPPPMGSPGTTYGSGGDRLHPSGGQAGFQGGYPSGGDQPGGPAPGGWYPESPQPPARKSRRGLIIAVSLAAVLVVVAIGGYVGWSLTNRTSQFTVGACVKQDGNSATVVDCGTPGAYEIKSIVDTDGTCPDPEQPSLVLTQVGSGKKYACLAPTGSSTP